MDPITACDIDRILSYLNELVALDKEAIESLIETRVKCNKDMAEHPTVQIMRGQDGCAMVGFLGILNGLIGTQPDGLNHPGWGYIAAKFDDRNGRFINFTRIDK